MKRFLAISLIVMMALTVIPVATGTGPDAVSAATGSGGGGGGGGTTGTAPKAPSTLALPAGYTAGATSVKLTWKDNATNETGFKVERFLVGGSSWTLVTTTEANATSYTDTSAKAASSYVYRVKATNSYGTSAASNELKVTTGASEAPAPVTPVTYSSTPSDWAAAEIELAKTAGLTVDSLMADYNKPITRAEFSALVVKLYEKATGAVITPVTENPFKDTTDEAVLKAYTVGIIKGVSADQFAPTANVTRQEMAVMLQRELKAANPAGTFDAAADFAPVFTDANKIASWSLGAVKFMNQEGIVTGIGGGSIDPTGNATREQSMLMIYRDYVKFVQPAATPAQ